MAKSVRPAPRPATPARPAPAAEAAPAGYFEALARQAADPDKYEVMLPKTVHGVRRASVHRKI